MKYVWWRRLRRSVPHLVGDLLVPSSSSSSSSPSDNSNERMDDDDDDDENGNNTRSRKFPHKSHHPSQPLVRLRLALFLTAVGTLVILLWLHWRSRPNMDYDRALDDSLMQLVRTSTAASRLPTSGRLFCWVLTSEKYHDTRARAVHDTWLKRCSRGELFTNAVFRGDLDLSVPYSTVFAGLPDSYDKLFEKTRAALHYLAQNYLDQFDWFLKADDDTYVVVEHLLNYLSRFDPSQPMLLGYRLKPGFEHGYVSGGAGYVMSRGALRLFDEKLHKNATLCPDSPYEDYGLSKCFESVGIYPHDTRDHSDGSQRFTAYKMGEYSVGRLPGDGDPNYWLFDPLIKGEAGFSRHLISLHHLSPDEIRLADLLLYRVQSPAIDSNPSSSL